MSHRKKTKLLNDPEVITRVIFMVVGIDHSLGIELIAKLHEFVLPMNKARVDEQTVDKKGMDPVKRDA